MYKKTLLVALIATFTISANAQFGGLSALGGGSGDSGPTPDKMLAEYIVGSAAVLLAQSQMLDALGQKEAAEEALAASKSMTAGATTEIIKSGEKIQTEESQKLQELMADKSIKLNAEGKKKMAIGITSLGVGIVGYVAFVKSAKNFKPSLTSIGGAAATMAVIIPRLPEDGKALSSLAQSTISYAKREGIKVDTSQLSGTSAL
jgi:hypothetical protein